MLWLIAGFLALVVYAYWNREHLRAFWEMGQTHGHRFAADNRGGMGVVAMVITVIVAAIAILIGIIVYANVSTAMPTTNLDNETQQMITNLNSNVNSSFTLLSIGIIILGASFILTVLIVSLGRAAQ